MCYFPNPNLGILWLFFTESGSQRQLNSYSVICVSINSVTCISKANSLVPKTYLSVKVNEERTGRLVFSEKDANKLLIYAHTFHFKYFLKVTGAVNCQCDDEEEFHRTPNDFLWKSLRLLVQGKSFRLRLNKPSDIFVVK